MEGIEQKQTTLSSEINAYHTYCKWKHVDGQEVWMASMCGHTKWIDEMMKGTVAGKHGDHTWQREIKKAIIFFS